MADPFEAIRAHVEKHAGKERATFSIVGIKAVLAEIDNRDQETGRTAQASPEGVPCGGVSRQDQVATAEILDTVERWRKWAHEWSGSAFVSGEKLPEAGEGMSEDEHKSELYSGLCRLGSNLQWLHDELSTALASQPVPAVAVTDAMVRAYKHSFAEYMNKSARGHITPPTPDVGFNATKYALGVALATATCATCNGRGEVGGFINAESGYQTDPCPDCAFAPAIQAVPDMVRPICRVMTMQHSSCAPDHYVSIEVGDRQITPHMFKTKGRAEYEVAEWIWLLNGGEKPSILDFDTDPQSLCGASHPASSESQSPAGAKIRSTQGNAMQAAPVTGQSPVGAVSPCVSAPEKGTRLDETWNYRIPETLADLIPLFENRVACHRLWAEWLDQDTEETRRIASSGIGCARAHWDYVKQYSAAKSLIEEHERGAVTDAMIEAVARGICKLHCFDPDRPTSRSGLRLKWMDYTEQAREALAASNSGKG